MRGACASRVWGRHHTIEGMPEGEMFVPSKHFAQRSLRLLRAPLSTIKRGSLV